ncbi:MAG: nitrophenyl compound nitroreductase subunit ArsF family protein [Archaeoglobaceae archaeon]
MPEKRALFKVLLITLISIMVAFSGCSSTDTEDQDLSTPQGNPTETQTGEDSGDDQDVRVEVIHFHGTNQCYSCEKVGELAEKTVKTYFEDELQSEKLVFKHINGELSKNREIVSKYEATGSSLWIGTYINDSFHKEVNNRVWYKIEDEQEYMNYLKGILEKRLEGDLS